MIDIHTHILPNVDDGSDSTEISIQMLKDAKNQGITDVFLTPHYRARYKRDKKNNNKAYIITSISSRNSVLEYL